MLTCEDCGCLVDPELTDRHQEFHDSLVKINHGPVANPNRTKWGDLNVLPAKADD